MKAITEPKVYLVGRQQVNEVALDRFLADHDVATWETDADVAGEKLVEVAGRLCYMSFAKPRPGGNEAYIGHILEVGHGSVLEHAVFNFIIAGVSRSFSHELVRHRAGFGYSQLSQRFVDEGDAEFVVPPALAEEVAAGLALSERIKAGPVYPAPKTTEAAEMGMNWLLAVEHSQHFYKQLSDYLFRKYSDVEDQTLRRKKAREAARSVLPNATETKVFVTGNARALRHFVEMRGDVSADAEIRSVAVAMLGVLQSEAPHLFGDYVVADGSVSTPFRKV